ncbi:MAG: paraquat-inducible protein A [Burkholderiales bacterium]|nr:paraquat-inducible protein A [Burkholderiales bacterium]
MRTETTASELGLVACHACALVCKAPAGAQSGCPRCGAYLHRRKPDSIARTWALLIAAALLYIPANLLPIMESTTLLESQQDTIMSGVIYLWMDGSWPVAAIVFIASIGVPLLKLIVLSGLLVSVQRRSTWRPLQRARLYRLVDFVGRWSMLDIFVLALLVGLVQLKALAFVEVGPAAVAFGGVVVLTMLASISFDPRLIWDPIKNKNG